MALGTSSIYAGTDTSGKMILGSSLIVSFALPVSSNGVSRVIPLVVIYRMDKFK